MKRAGGRPGVCTWFLLDASALVCPAARAAFYRWLDKYGEYRVSNIPPAGIGADGRPRDGYHPYSIIAQQSRLRATLLRQAGTPGAAQPFIQSLLKSSDESARRANEAGREADGGGQRRAK